MFLLPLSMKLIFCCYFRLMGCWCRVYGPLVMTSAYHPTAYISIALKFLPQNTIHHLSTILTFLSSFHTTLRCLSLYLLSLSKYTSYTFFVSCRYYIFMEQISLTPFRCFGFKNNWWSCRIVFSCIPCIPISTRLFPC